MLMLQTVIEVVC